MARLRWTSIAMQPSSLPAALALSAAGLRKRFGPIVAVDDVGFEVHAGQCVGLLGPNGAGKSTTLSLLAGLERPDRGSVSILGVNDPTQPEVRRALGFVPQQIALYPDLTVDENLAFFARVHGVAQRDLPERVAAALALARLVERRGSRVGTLSGGMQRRLNLACATLHEPRVLLLDEPTVGVDRESREHLFEGVRALTRRGAAVVYSTHHLDEAEQLCERVLIVDRGRVVLQGAPRELCRRLVGEHRVRARVDAAAARALGATVSDDGWISVGSDDVREGLERLLALGLPLAEVSVERATLEDVFAALGRRSAQAAEGGSAGPSPLLAAARSES